MSFTAIDLEGSILRVVQSSQRRQKGQITQFATKELRFPEGANPVDPKVAGPAIAAALKELRLAPSEVIMGLPRAVVLLRPLNFPATGTADELAAMVHIQVGKDLPFPAEEAVVDFKVQPRSAWPRANPPSAAPPASNEPEASAAGLTAEKVEVLAAAVRTSMVEQYRATAEAAELDLAGLGMLSYANARGLEACGIGAPGESIALVSLRAEEVSIDVLCNGSLIFSRTATIQHPSHGDSAPEPPAPVEKTEAAPAAAPPATSAPPEPAATPEEEFVRAITIEVVRSLHSYEGLGRDNHIQKVVVVGATGFETAAVQALQSRFNLPSSLLEPAAALRLQDINSKHAAGALGVIGLALSAADAIGLPFDFLNPKRPPVPRDTRKIKIAAGIAAALVLLLTGLAVRHRLIRQRLEKKAAIEQQLAAEQKHQPIYRQTRQQARTIQDWLKGNQPWLDHYAYLSMILPPQTELYVASLSTSARGTLQLSVQARAGETIAGLDKTLRSAGYEVKPLAITPTADRFGYPFKSTIELSVPAGKKIDFNKIFGGDKKEPTAPASPRKAHPTRSGATAANRQF